MALTFGFFNSVNGDRKYNSRQISKMFDGLITDGVIAHVGSHFNISAGTGMSIVVGTGRAWFNHVWCENDSNYIVSVDAATPAINRTDYLVMEIDNRDTVRGGSIKMLMGQTNGSPPTLTSTDEVHQHILAKITVPSGATSISQSNINVRVGTDDCPLATGVLKGISIENFLADCRAQFFEWVEKIKDDVEDPAVDFVIRLNDCESDIANLKPRVSSLEAIFKDMYKEEYVVNTFTSSGTFTYSSPLGNDTDTLTVMCVGPGGNGGSTIWEKVNYGGIGCGGGGGGGYISKRTISASSLPSSKQVSVTVSSSGTSFGSFVSAAKGGNGGNGTFTNASPNNLIRGGNGGSGSSGGGGGSGYGFGYFCIGYGGNGGTGSSYGSGGGASAYCDENPVPGNGAVAYGAGANGSTGKHASSSDNEYSSSVSFETPSGGAAITSGYNYTPSGGGGGGGYGAAGGGGHNGGHGYGAGGGGGNGTSETSPVGGGGGGGGYGSVTLATGSPYPTSGASAVTPPGTGATGIVIVKYLKRSYKFS